MTELTLTPMNLTEELGSGFGKVQVGLNTSIYTFGVQLIQDTGESDDVAAIILAEKMIYVSNYNQTLIAAVCANPLSSRAVKIMAENSNHSLGISLTGEKGDTYHIRLEKSYEGTSSAPKSSESGESSTTPKFYIAVGLVALVAIGFFAYQQGLLPFGSTTQKV